MKRKKVLFQEFSCLQDEIERFYAEKEITVHGRDVPNPVFAFEEACFPGEFVLYGLVENMSFV